MKLRLIFLTFLFCLLVACAPTINVIGPDGRTIILPKCQSIIKYYSDSLVIKSVEIPIPKAPITIGEVTWEPKLLQQACEIAQILESHRIRTCELLPALATAGSPEMFQKALGEMLNDNYRLTSLALLITSNDDEGVKMWIDTNRKRSFALIKVAPIEKNVLAEITRARSFEEKKEALEAATSQVEETMRPHISSFASPFSYKGFRFLSSWDTGLPTEHWALGAEWGGAVGKMSPWRRKHPE